MHARYPLLVCTVFWAFKELGPDQQLRACAERWCRCYGKTLLSAGDSAGQEEEEEHDFMRRVFLACDQLLVVS